MSIEFSKPIELNWVGKQINNSLNSVFQPWLPENQIDTALTASVLLSDRNPDNPIIAEIPSDMPERYQDHYVAGIQILNEWAAHLATQYYFENLQIPLASGYGKYQSSISRFKIPRIDEWNKDDDLLYDAVFSALFSHDVEKLTQLVEPEKEYFVMRDLDDTWQAFVARTGYNNTRSSNPQLNEPQENPRPYVEPYRWSQVLRFSLNSWGTNMFEGTAEYSLAPSFRDMLVVLAGGAMLQLIKPENQEILPFAATCSAAVFSGANIRFPYTAVHEIIHDKSRGNGFVGLIKVKNSE